MKTGKCRAAKARHEGNEARWSRQNGSTRGPYGGHFSYGADCRKRARWPPYAPIRSDYGYTPSFPRAPLSKTGPSCPLPRGRNRERAFSSRDALPVIASCANSPSTSSFGHWASLLKGEDPFHGNVSAYGASHSTDGGKLT